MRKKLILGLFALALSGGLAVFGNSRGFIDSIVDSFSNGFVKTFTSDERRAWEVVAKAGHTKRSSRKGLVVSREIPESMLWHVAFDFTRKIETKATEVSGPGNDGALFGNYFIRQGGLSVTSDKILKETAARYFEEVGPIEQRAKVIIENARRSSSDLLARTPELNDLKAQKDAAALRNRDSVKRDLGDVEFNALLKFLKGDFSEGAVSGMMSPSEEVAEASPKGIFYEGWSWIIWDDSQQPPLITGFSELYFYYFAPIAPYDPSLDSFFVNLTAQSVLSAGSADGYRDWFPALYFHPVFFSIRGNQYCTLTDFYAVLYDGPFPIDTVYLDSNGVCHVVGPAPPTPSPTPTPNVASVTLSQVNPSTELISQNPAVSPHNPGIGRRIFPDKDFPNEDTNVIDRRLVRVTATLSQPIANVPVYFRNFDLDDPTTDPTIDPNGTAGNDNRNDNTGVPNAGQLLFANGCGANGPSVFCPTDANGVATIVFRVSRQPGNNFAVAASISPIAVNGVMINGIELNDSGGQPVVTENCPTQAICRSQMLTVWRRLHIEVDSMGASTQNFVVGNSATFARVRSFSPAVNLNLNTSDPLEVNRFENGRIVFGSSQLRVVSNTTNSVSVTNSLPGPNPVTVNVGAQFQLYDDDDFNDNNGNVLAGDTGEDIPGADAVSIGATEMMQPNDVACGQFVTSGCNSFASAYVRPVYDLVLVDNTDNGLFQANIAPGDERTIFQNDFDQVGNEDDPTFWTIALYAAYQGPGVDGLPPGFPPGGLDGDPPDSDGDGNPPHGCPETAFGVADRVGPGGLGAGIFVEVLRPREYPADYLNRPISPARTAAHEVGHLFGGEHADGGLMAPSCGASTLATGFVLDPRSIVRLRRDILNP